MAMEENVAFDPSIGPIQINQIIATADEHVVQQLEDRPRPLATGEIEDVVIVA